MVSPSSFFPIHDFFSFFLSKLPTLITPSFFHENQSSKNQTCSVFHKEHNGIIFTSLNSKNNAYKTQNQSHIITIQLSITSNTSMIICKQLKEHNQYIIVYIFTLEVDQ